ncbi:MAG TPA: type IV pilus assembly protein PilM [Pyrinomonadaceae bacterium]|jgi:type IV pilus assembly protein PilM|nr:type IV pilus assembly protein PilM [Pyrinomonadaceae bacterium]
MFKKRSLGKKSLVGLDIGSSSVKAVELQGKPGNLSLSSLGFESLQPDTVVDGQIMELNDVSNVIAEVFRNHQMKTDRVAAGVSGSSVIVKNIIVPQMSREELEESIDWHAEEHIPFDISDVSLDYQIVGSGPDSLHVLMAACKRDFIANLKQAIQLAGKQPAIIDVDAFALQNCYEINYMPPEDAVVALLNVGASTMNINILKGIKSVFTRDVSVGGNQYTALLQKELGLTYEQAEAIKRGGLPPSDVPDVDIEGVLETVSDMLALEISKTFDFYRATAEEADAGVQKILISGGGSKLKGLSQFLSGRFEVPVEPFDPFRQIKVDARRFDPEYMRDVVPEMAVAVGLALRGVEA